MNLSDGQKSEGFILSFELSAHLLLNIYNLPVNQQLKLFFIIYAKLQN